MSEEIFREVDEELREENLLRLWRRFGPYVVAVAVAVIAVTASSVGWKEYRASQLQAWGSSFSEAMALGGLESPASAAAAFVKVRQRIFRGGVPLSKSRRIRSIRT